MKDKNTLVKILMVLLAILIPVLGFVTGDLIDPEKGYYCPEDLQNFEDKCMYYDGTLIAGVEHDISNGAHAGVLASIILSMVLFFLFIMTDLFERD